jgi:hypothetical protein
MFCFEILNPEGNITMYGKFGLYVELGFDGVTGSKQAICVMDMFCTHCGFVPAAY